jgi:4-hydroxy-L-threonine phosphate dehydrogenase PdxA
LAQIRHAHRISGETLAYMIDLALAERLDGITLAPLNKAALHAGGWRFNDEHQMFAHLTRHEGYFGEMNVSRQSLDVARDVACFAANRARPDYAYAYR